MFSMKKTIFILSVSLLSSITMSAQSDVKKTPKFVPNQGVKTLEVGGIKSNSKISQVSADGTLPVSREEPKSNDVADYKTTPNGLLYKFEREAPNRITLEPGDLAHLHVEYWMGDSLIFNTKTINGNQPVAEVVKNYSYPADVNEGIMMLSPGDIAIFKTTLANLSTHTKTPIPPFITGEYATWRIEMTGYKTKEELNKDQANLAEKEDQEIKNYLTKNKLQGTRLESGVYVVTHEEGTGDLPTKGQTISVNYTGKLLNGTVFDSNIDPKFNHVYPIEFPVGQGRMIKGWDEAFITMRPGQKATLIIPSSLAYGKRSPSPDIPANSILVFDVEFLKIVK